MWLTSWATEKKRWMTGRYGGRGIGYIPWPISPSYLHFPTISTSYETIKEWVHYLGQRLHDLVTHWIHHLVVRPSVYNHSANLSAHRQYRMDSLAEMDSKLHVTGSKDSSSLPNSNVFFSALSCSGMLACICSALFQRAILCRLGEVHRKQKQQRVKERMFSMHY